MIKVSEADNLKTDYHYNSQEKTLLVVINKLSTFIIVFCRCGHGVMVCKVQFMLVRDALKKKKNGKLGDMWTKGR